MRDIVEDVVEIGGVTKRFPGALALDNVSLGFRQGEVHAVIGEDASLVPGR